MPREKKDKGKGKAQGPYDKAEPAAEEDPGIDFHLCPFTLPIIFLLVAMRSHDIDMNDHR